MDQQPTCSKYTHFNEEDEKVEETKPLSRYTMYILPKHSVHNVYVSYAGNGPHEIWIQLDSAKQILSVLGEKLSKIPLQTLKYKPKIGTACIVKRYKSTLRSRGMVVDIRANCTYMVLFVDYGNTAYFSWDEMYTIPSRFIQPKVMAMRYTLAESQTLQLTSESLHAFRKFCNNKLLKMLVVEEGTLESLPLCKLRFGNVTAIDILKSNLMLRYLPRAAPDVATDVTISHVNNCGDFYIQEKSSISELRKINAIVQQNCRTAPTIHGSQLSEGLPCCAVSPVDNKWYRTKVLSNINDVVKVSYIDYGDKHTVKLTDLRMPRTNRLTTTCPFALKCSLSGYDDRKDSPANGALYKLIAAREFKMRVVAYKNAVPQVELLDEEGHSVTEELEKELHSLSLGSVPEEDQTEE
ncbi:hypothetical protein PPYR_05787 [Photinus pyralis]|uniref:Tudor domain-containing protein n=1 Tax=Photinus pyralis TaxID=7054 RepID=A0A1Y1LFW0_PHOPY|nr:maternal protein tudor-like [Photinus pyralis]KAB0801433.1 hypothetical protein PPYR_05787 [Photinus pyralis]